MAQSARKEALVNDWLTPAERRERMRRIRGRNTAPELLVRGAVHALGFRFRLHRRDLPGTPDLVLPRHRKVIFVHGCFWHQHEGCRLKRQPKSRLGYWLPKLRRNVERDDEVRGKLEGLGWACLVVWECDTKDREALSVACAGLVVGQDAPSDRSSALVDRKKAVENKIRLFTLGAHPSRICGCRLNEPVVAVRLAEPGKNVGLARLGGGWPSARRATSPLP
ncbi:MAG: DNA mismatch endonuclease Vsr, partial [Sphingomonas sp.]|nr:DNA mismatch endonuclease Vsr [Sphingomonas sp.]